MFLHDRLKEEMKLALKAKDKMRLSTVRLILASVKNKEIEMKGALNDDDIVQILSTMVKQRKDSIEHFKKADRIDLSSKEEAELKIVMSFMPPQLPREEIEKLVQETIKSVEAQGMRDMGKVMKELMPKVKGRAEGAVVKGIVQEKLSSLS